MDRDQLILALVEGGHLIVDHEQGLIWRTRGSYGRELLQPAPIRGANVNGYRVAKFVYRGQKQMIRLHHIIWVSKNGPVPENHVIDHINRDRTDNRIANLRVATYRESTLNRRDFHGENHPHVKLTWDEVDEIRAEWKRGEKTMVEMAEEWGVSSSNINAIVNNHTWQEEHRPKVDDMARYTDPRWGGNPLNAFGEDWEDGVPRVCGSVPQRTAKLKALGNSLVPQVAWQLFQAIDEAVF